ncbi:MAG: hypothetical protein H6732_08075 [Alphaproteobacteria bacterium]|nr:hypothetical protein [Alphaproteobacteria bacterium]
MQRGRMVAAGMGLVLAGAVVGWASWTAEEDALHVAADAAPPVRGQGTTPVAPAARTAAMPTDAVAPADEPMERPPPGLPGAVPAGEVEMLAAAFAGQRARVEDAWLGALEQAPSSAARDGQGLVRGGLARLDALQRDVDAGRAAPLRTMYALEQLGQEVADALEAAGVKGASDRLRAGLALDRAAEPWGRPVDAAGVQERLQAGEAEIGPAAEAELGASAEAGIRPAHAEPSAGARAASPPDR